MGKITRYSALITICLTITWLVAGCGYKNPYLDSDGATRPPISMHVPMWTNQTNELGLESLFHRELTGWLQKTKQINIVSAGDKADYILKGTLLSIEHPGLSYGEFDQAVELEVRVKVSYSLTEIDSGNVVIKNSKRNLDEAYFVAQNWTMTRGNLEKGLAKMADELAESIYMEIMSSGPHLPSPLNVFTIQ
ncbi:MAG: LptE family protein [Thermodesulfobacteriota bacterium]|nr:LptE family protein [Thermodesulfobacteriota bacterium]